MNKIGSRIRSQRLQHQLTQAQLADALQVRYQTVSKWETGSTLPDTAMLPRIADIFGISLDELFGRMPRCGGCVPEEDTAFLLKTYAAAYGPEAGPWNLSAANRYLEYRFAAFFEKHFPVADNANICNIGIGAGEWDRYLSYQLKSGSLTSIDRLEICCRQLKKRLLCEGNPNRVTVLCADAMTLELPSRFEIVTMVGSTVMESKMGLALLEKAMEFVKPGGALYYQSLDAAEDPNMVLQSVFSHGMRLSTYSEEESYGFHCRYYKFQKQ